MPQDESVAQSQSARPSPPRAMQLEDLFRYDRLADPRLSPDGRTLVYQATRFSDPAKNSKSTQLWLAPLNGGEARQLTYSGKADTHPRWSPDVDWVTVLACCW